MDVDEAYDDNGKAALLSSVVADNYTNSCEASLHQNNYAVTLRTWKIMQPLLLDQALKAEHGSLYLRAGMPTAEKYLASLRKIDKFCMLFR